MILGKFRLQPGIPRIGTVGKATHQLFERLEGKLGHLLITTYIRDLVVIAGTDQIMGIGHILVPGMKVDEAPGRIDRLVKFAGLVEGVSRHQLTAGRPLGIGMLPFDLLKGGGGTRVVALFELVERRVVKVVDRPLDIGRVLRTVAGAGGEQEGQPSHARMPETLANCKQSSAPFGPLPTSKLNCRLSSQSVRSPTKNRRSQSLADCQAGVGHGPASMLPDRNRRAGFTAGRHMRGAAMIDNWNPRSSSQGGRRRSRRLQRGEAAAPVPRGRVRCFSAKRSGRQTAHAIACCAWHDRRNRQRTFR